MTEQYITYPRYGWNIAVFYEVTCDDTERIIAELSDIGCRDVDLYKARKNIASCKRNNGITFANMRNREMVVVLTKTTSAKEFLNTLVHELHHMAEFVAICDGIPLSGEEISYISGDLSMLMYGKAAHLLCGSCRGERT